MQSPTTITSSHRLRLSLISAIGWALITAACLPANATIINVNLTQSPLVQKLDGTTWNPITPVSPAPYDGTVWTDTASLSENNLPYSDGSGPSPIGFVIDSGGVADNWTGPLTMLLGGRYSMNTLTLNYVPAGKYELYLASEFNGDDGGVFTITGFSPKMSTGTQGSSWLEGENYVHFTDLHPVGGVISVTITTADGQTLRILDGFQLVQDVPEPTSLALLGIGAGLLWLRRRSQS